MIQSAENFKEHRFHFFDILQILEPHFQDQPDVQDPSPKICVLEPGDVLGGPKSYRFSSHFENFLLVWADPLYKLIVYMLSSIWL